MVQELTRYAKNLMYKSYFYNYKSAYSQSFETFDEGKKIILKYFMNEVLRIKGKRQYSGIPPDYEKVCNRCKELKHQSEFAHVFDKRYDLHYLRSRCRDCEIERQREYRKNNPLTEEQKKKLKLGI